MPVLAGKVLMTQPVEGGCLVGAGALPPYSATAVELQALTE